MRSTVNFVPKILVIAVVFVGTACSHLGIQTQPHELEMGNTEKGVAAGAVVGAGLGLLIGSSAGSAGEGLVLGSLAGAAIGGAVGANLKGAEDTFTLEEQVEEVQDNRQLIDEQELKIKELREEVQDDQFEIPTFNRSSKNAASAPNRRHEWYSTAPADVSHQSYRKRAANREEMRALVRARMSDSAALGTVGSSPVDIEPEENLGGKEINSDRYSSISEESLTLPPPKAVWVKPAERAVARDLTVPQFPAPKGPAPKVPVASEFAKRGTSRAKREMKEIAEIDLAPDPVVPEDIEQIPSSENQPLKKIRRLPSAEKALVKAQKEAELDEELKVELNAAKKVASGLPPAKKPAKKLAKRPIEQAAKKIAKKAKPKIKKVTKKTSKPKKKVITAAKAVKKTEEKVASTPKKIEKKAAKTVAKVDKTVEKTVQAKVKPKRNPHCEDAEIEADRARSATSDADKLFYFRRALRLCKDEPKFHIEIGRVYSTIGRTEDAQFEFNKALELNPESEEAQDELSVMMLEKEQ